MVPGFFLASLQASSAPGLSLNQGLISAACRLLLGLAAVLVMRALARRQLALSPHACTWAAVILSAERRKMTRRPSSEPPLEGLAR